MRFSNVTNGVGVNGAIFDDCLSKMPGTPSFQLIDQALIPATDDPYGRVRPLWSNLDGLTRGAYIAHR